MKIKSKCRNCKHSYHFVNCNSGYVIYNSIGKFSKELSEFSPCICSEYVPFDNIEYLEYMYEKELNYGLPSNKFN